MTVGGSDARWATSDLINERLDFKFLRDPDDLVSDCDHSRKSCSYETKPAITAAQRPGVTRWHARLLESA